MFGRAAVGVYQASDDGRVCVLRSPSANVSLRMAVGCARNAGMSANAKNAGYQ